MHVASTRRAKECALSLLSLFRRQCRAAAGAGRIRGVNGLPGFPEKRSERDPVLVQRQKNFQKIQMHAA
jgi:hypothetical protein